MEQNLIIVPEFIIHSSLENMFRFLRADYNENTATPEKSYLLKLIGSLGFERYNYVDQAKRVFLSTEEDPRFLSVDLMFNNSKDNPPSIHVCMPSESPGQNALGMDQGSSDSFVNFQQNSEGEQEAVDVNVVFKRRYKATYDVVIVSDNSNEVVMLYHMIRSMLTALTPHFTLSGLENMVISGQDLQPYAELAPKHLFMRALRLGLEYESGALNFEKHLLINGIVFENKVVNEL